MPFPDLFPYKFIRLEETQSTNTYLKELCKQHPTDEFSVVTTRFQTAGRGQRGNFWESEPKQNLLFSLLVRPVFLPVKAQFFISQIISLSIKEELDQYAENFSIKWPNDIYWNEQKICGILIEHNLTGAYLSDSIIGVGININQTLFHSSAPNPVSLLQITGNEHQNDIILKNILKRFAAYYQKVKEGSTQLISSRYQEALFRKKGFHSYTDKEGLFMAQITNVAPDGTLTLTDPSGKTRNYFFKEVSFVL